MKHNGSIGQKLTILVNSCDAYDDLWEPFFTLFKRYWDPTGVRILLNTESKTYCHEGLEIECIHSPNEPRYGQRMLNALSHVKTPYVLSLLDDFFIRRDIDDNQLAQIMQWMDDDPDIACFTCDCNEVYADWEVDRYPGFRRQPPGNAYLLSMQAGIWRTEQFTKYWRPDVNPWEWELLCNSRTVRFPKDKFYCLTDYRHTFIDYGFSHCGHLFGVFRGKWVIEDIEPFFAKENISINYSLRGIYDPSVKKAIVSGSSDRRSRYNRVARCLGQEEVHRYFLFNQYCRIMNWLGKPVKVDYFKFIRDRAKEKFLKSIDRGYK